MSTSTYGQYCPIALSLELIGQRWTLLVLRELIDGSTRFNDIHRGVPAMSRSLLSDRLRALATVQIVTRERSASSGQWEYCLTKAGRSLLPVIGAIGQWGQEWIDKSPALDGIDGGYLMWSIRKSASWQPEMGPRMVARFEFTDRADDLRLNWLVFEPEAIDLCHVDPGHEVDVWIETTLRAMVEVWMGWRPIATVRKAGELRLDGPAAFTDDPLSWIGQSPLAGIGERPREAQIAGALGRLKP